MASCLEHIVKHRVTPSVVWSDSMYVINGTNDKHERRAMLHSVLHGDLWARVDAALSDTTRRLLDDLELGEGSRRDTRQRTR